jgi:hypothetical protein
VAPAFVQDVGHLGRRQPVVHGDRDRTQLGQRKRGFDPLVAVARKDAHAVAALDAQAAHAIGEAAAARIDLAPAQPMVLEDQTELAARHLRIAAQHVAHSGHAAEDADGPAHDGISAVMVCMSGYWMARALRRPAMRSSS